MEQYVTPSCMHVGQTRIRGGDANSGALATGRIGQVGNINHSSACQEKQGLLWIGMLPDTLGPPLSYCTPMLEGWRQPG